MLVLCFIAEKLEFVQRKFCNVNDRLMSTLQEALVIKTGDFLFVYFLRFF